MELKKMKFKEYVFNLAQRLQSYRLAGCMAERLGNSLEKENPETAKKWYETAMCYFSFVGNDIQAARNAKKAGIEYKL